MQKNPPSPDLTIMLHVIPKSSKNEVAGWVDSADGAQSLKGKVTAAPEDGKANKAVLGLLAKYWGCAKADIALVSGATNRHKRLKILDLSLGARIMDSMS